MKAERDKLIEEALALPEGDRVELIERLLNSLDSEARQTIDAAWAEEAERRLDSLERGEIESTPGHAVFRLLAAGKRP